MGLFVFVSVFATRNSVASPMSGESKAFLLSIQIHGKKDLKTSKYISIVIIERFKTTVLFDFNQSKIVKNSSHNLF